MIDLKTPFQLNFQGQQLEVEPQKAGGSLVFIVRFSKGTQPLVITRAHGEKRPVFWTSIPEGRQREAEQIGPHITEHYQALAAAQ